MLGIAASVEKRQMVFVSENLKSGGEGRHPWAITVMCRRSLMRVPSEGAGPSAEVREGKEVSSGRKITKTQTASYQTRSTYPFIRPVVSTDICKVLRKMIGLTVD